LSLPDGCALDCELSRELLARKFGGIAISNARQLPGNCAEVSETSRRIYCRMVRGHCVTVLRDSADFSTSHWQVVKTLRS